MSLNSYDPGTGRNLRKVKINIPKEKAFTSIEDIMWDGEYIWIACSAGFSSSFLQIDIREGNVVKSIFANCNPRGITTDMGYIYSICYNGEKFPAKIDRRPITGDEKGIDNTRVFLGNIEGTDVTGLTFDGDNLWYADRKSKKAYKFLLK